MNRSEFYILRNAISGVENFPEAYAVIECTNPGEVYVNDIKNPRSALIWNQGMQCHYFIGETQNEDFLEDIKEYVNDIIIKELQAKGINWFEVIGVHRKWESVIEELFSDKGIKYEHQYVYRMHENKKEIERATSKNEIYIEKLTKDVLKSNILNLEFMINELELFWGTMENFFEKGTCYYAIENKKVVSICYSGFKVNGLETIGIETLSDHRKKGYAYELALRFIEDCISRSFSPYWDCSEDNTGSRRLAEKLGFDKVSDYKCFWFNF